MKNILFLLFVVAVVSPAFLCTPPRKVAETQTTDNSISEVISYLASDALEGRGTGTDGEKKAGEFISSEFSHAGLEPMGDNGSWFQSFTFKPKSVAQIHGQGDTAKLGMALVKEITGRNVIGFLDKGNEYTIVIGAHYDHLGWGDENSLWTGERAIHNGADDNASGVAALIQLAKTLSKQSNLKYNFLFIAFSGEEKGLWGSNYFCKNPTLALEKVNCMLNMDMVGRLNAEHTLAVYGTGTSPVWKQLLPGIMPNEIKQVTTESGVGPSDHTSFYNMNLPVLHFFTGQHEDYHKPTDDTEKINIAGEQLVIKFIEQVIAGLNDLPKLEFTKTKDESVASASDFKVTLGVVPDYLYSGEGMRIDGVKEGRPAAKAGMKQGDVVMQIGEVIVTDMSTYMKALGSFQKGESTIVKIKRGEEVLDMNVVWE